MEFTKDLSTGVIASVDDQMVAYMIGYIYPGGVFERSAWVQLAGYGGQEKCFREMYSFLAKDWISDRCFLHEIMVPSLNRELLELWYSLSFGQEQIYGVLDFKELGVPQPLNIEIRETG